MAKEHDLLGRGRESHVFGFGGREGNAILLLASPRNMAAQHHRDEAGARAAVNPISERRILPEKELGRDIAREKKTKVHCVREVAENTCSLFPMASYRRRHVTVEEADNSKDVGTGHVGIVE